MIVSMAIGHGMDEDNMEQRKKVFEFFNYLDTDQTINPDGSEGILVNYKVLQRASDQLKLASGDEFLADKFAN